MGLLLPLIGATCPLYEKANEVNALLFLVPSPQGRSNSPLSLYTGDSSPKLRMTMYVVQGRTKFPSTHNVSVTYSLKYAIRVNLFITGEFKRGPHRTPKVYATVRINSSNIKCNRKPCNIVVAGAQPGSVVSVRKIKNFALCFNFSKGQFQLQAGFRF